MPALREAVADEQVSPELVNSALKAELDALRAVRAADRAEIDAIVGELQPLIAEVRMMPQVEIKIGGRSFEVACQDGEEHFLRSAAAMLDIEAQSLSNQIGRMPESRMLLMAGLLLADKTAGLEDTPARGREPDGDRLQMRPRRQTPAAGRGAGGAAGRHRDAWPNWPPAPRRWPTRSRIASGTERGSRSQTKRAAAGCCAGPLAL